MTLIVDSHCHLDYLARHDGVMEDAINTAFKSGVGYMQSISTSMTTFPDVLKIANHYNNIFCSVGVHPCHVQNEKLVEYENLLTETKHSKVIGIGESGMDLFHDATTIDIQEKSFRTHISVARKTGIPVIVHTRNADNETMDIMKNEYKSGSYPALIHCFTANEQLAIDSIDMGFYISISGIITFPNTQEIRDVVKNVVPMDRLLVETDSPYLAPKPFRGKPCQPSYVVHTAEALAYIKGIDYSEIANQTTDNFFTLFKKAVR